ncbi:MAG TPA: hypothetical protein DEW35_05305 [Ruminococcaceae bacterium]|nr:hypothetical protein [Oscillospiraceae bacterium]
MVIYADVLFILNTVTDYFLIKLSGVFVNRAARLWRICLSAILGGLSSFYIFLPSPGMAIDVPLKILICAILIFTAYGFENIKLFLKLTATLFSVTFLLGGIVSAFVFYFRPRNIYINNNIPYIDINPVIFIVSGVFYYIIALTVKTLTERQGEFAKECRLSLYLESNEYNLSGLIDTGNSITDIFGLSEIIIAEKATVETMYDSLTAEDKLRRFRSVPVKTVSGESVLKGIRIDKAIIKSEENQKSLINPIIVASNTEIEDGFGAIINPRSIL